MFVFFFFTLKQPFFNDRKRFDPFFKLVSIQPTDKD